MTKCLQQKIWNSLGLKMCSLSCNLISWGHIWTNGGGGKKLFCASAALSVKNEFWPSSTAAQFYFQVQYHSVSENTSVPCTPFDRMQFFTHFNISKRQEKKWAGEPQRKKSNLFSRIKMGWVLGLTFLLSSISCSNMALNTGERAGSSNIGETLKQQQRYLTIKQHCKHTLNHCYTNISNSTTTHFQQRAVCAASSQR